MQKSSNRCTKETEEKIAIMQAWVNGETIQLKSIYRDDCDWWDMQLQPYWNFEENLYRVKPKAINVTLHAYRMKSEIVYVDSKLGEHFEVLYEKVPEMDYSFVIKPT